MRHFQLNRMNLLYSLCFYCPISGRYGDPTESSEPSESTKPTASRVASCGSPGNDSGID